MIPDILKKNIQKNLLRWFDKHKRDLPWRKTRDPYAVWISEMMLQQTQVATVIPYYERFLKAFPTVHHLARADLSDVLRIWEGLGYYSRARNLHKAARTVVTRFNGTIPDNLKDLLSLPGIGRYTAGAILSIAFNRETPVLDGNVKRVLCRLYAIPEDPKESQDRRTALGHFRISHSERQCPFFQPGAHGARRHHVYSQRSNVSPLSAAGSLQSKKAGKS